MPIAKPSTRGQPSIKPAVPAALQLPQDGRPFPVQHPAEPFRTVSGLVGADGGADRAEGVAPLLRCSGSHAYELTATIRAAAAAIQDAALVAERNAGKTVRQIAVAMRV